MTPLNILVTGGSSGFGRIATQGLLKRGHRVLVLTRGDAAGQKASFGEPANLHVVQWDLAEKKSLRPIGLAVEDLFDSKLDVLINAAGYGLSGPIELQRAEDIDLQMQVNFFSPLQLIRECLPYLKERRGKILNLTSMAAFTVFPFYGTYAASKHALHAATEALYYELQPLGVQVCAIEPGGFKTEFRKNMKIAGAGEDSGYKDRMERFDRFLNEVVARIEKDPVQVGDLLVSLCERPRLRPRYIVGNDAWANMVFRRLIPDRLYMPFQHWLYKKFFF